MRLMLLVLLSGCARDAHESAHEGAHEVTHEVTQRAHGAHDQAPASAPSPEVHRSLAAPSKALALALNGDAKWQMDEHTRQVMAETRSTMGAAGVTTADQAQALGKTLQGQLDSLVQGCTMTGPAHDQLHIFLVAYMPGVAYLSSVEADEDAAPAVAELSALLDDYDRFFE